MGETAADTRQEIEQTRSELTGTVAELRHRGDRARDRLQRWLPAVAAGAAGAAAVAVTATVVVRRRRSGRLATTAKRLPTDLHPAVVPAARRADRWLDQRRRRLAAQREELLDAVAQRVAEQQAQADRKANPLWRRGAAKALETVATVGTAAVVRRLVEQAGSRRELSGTAQPLPHHAPVQ